MDNRLDFCASGGYKRRYRMRKPFFSIAAAAVFLLAVVWFALQAFSSGPSRVAAGSLMAAPASARLISNTGEVSSRQMAMVESPELVLVGKTGVLAISPPVTVTPKVLGAILGDLESAGFSSRDVTHYIIEEGDTIVALAEKFEISVNTILWANDLKANSALLPGKELVALPTSGTLHLIRPHDTLSELALWYKADVEEIKEFNGLASLQDIFVGDLLIIPGGAMPKTVPQGRLTPLANSYFIYPVPGPHRITQGLHGFNAVDFSNGKCGEPVYAAAGGTVQRAAYHGVGGNYVRVLHPNGVVTYYGHLASWAVNAGQKVLQGQIIGYIGHTGRTIPAGSAGCHTHFEVRGAGNPFAK